MDSLPTEIFNPLELDSFVGESHAVLDFLSDYYKDVESYPVQSQVIPGYLKKGCSDYAPDSPEHLEFILDDVRKNIIPGLTHWQSPNFFGYFQANASTAGFLGEMLCTGLNVVGFNWISSPATTELEIVVMDWMGQMLKLPQAFLFSGNGGGVIHGSTCEAILCTLAAARDKALKDIGEDKITKLVVYGSDQTHSALQKAAKLVGISPSNFRPIATSSSADFALSPNDVRMTMEQDLANGLFPLFLCATIGTTATGAVDPLMGLGLVARDYGVWLHVDAAYAGSACICPEFRPYLDGVELCDSISMNPHKWFLTNMDCCCLWLKDTRSLIESLSTNPEFLKNKASESNDVVDFKDWQIALSRRFRSIKLWVVIRRYGVANLRNHVRKDVELAKHFEGLLATDCRFEVVVPRKFALVGFHLKSNPSIYNDDVSKLNRKLLEAVNASGRAFMTHAVVEGTYMLRCAIGTTMTEERHIEGLWKLIQEKADLLALPNDD